MLSLHRQRVEAVFDGRWPDRFPICEQAFASSVASRILGREAHTGSTELHFQEGQAWLRGETAHEEFVDRVYDDVVALHRFFDFDVFMHPWRKEDRPLQALDEHTLLYGDPDGTPRVVGRYDPGSRTFSVERVGPALDGDGVIAEVRRELAQAGAEAEPPPSDPRVRWAAKELGEEFVISGSAGLAVPMQAGWLEATALDPGLIAEWVARKTGRVLAQLDVLREDGVRMVKGGGDFASNAGPVYSPRFFDEVMAPNWKKIFDRCRELGMWYVMRSDGNLWPVGETLFEHCRPDAYYEVDYDAGMHFDELRRAFRALVLMGNVSCDLLRRGTPEAVAHRARANLEAAAPRFVGASSNSILHGTPPENVFALYEAVKDYPVERLRSDGVEEGRAV